MIIGCHPVTLSGPALAGEVLHPVSGDERAVRACDAKAAAQPGGPRSGRWVKKAQDQESWFPAQLLVVLGVAVAHCFSGDRLD